MTKHTWEPAPELDNEGKIPRAYKCIRCKLHVYAVKEPEKTLTHKMSDCDIVIIRRVTEL